MISSKNEPYIYWKFDFWRPNMIANMIISSKSLFSYISESPDSYKMDKMDKHFFNIDVYTNPLSKKFSEE